ncbi:hypothetical protein NDU88_006494 [Pleurodeles waltl]|uniref:Uncharacterized protein n=1 Tax=Pleurodeles waltl TaxID=8319 RepID=A0AAV7WF08_PLEWA|nr:hypothetical protein NDU88_006494 [Pleurodeles waltl]
MCIFKPCLARMMHVDEVSKWGKQYVKSEWAKERNAVKVADEMSVEDGLVMKADMFGTPVSLGLALAASAHERHLRCMITKQKNMDYV